MTFRISLSLKMTTPKKYPWYPLDGVEKMGSRHFLVPGPYLHLNQHQTQNGHSNCTGAVYCAVTIHTMLNLLC